MRRNLERKNHDAYRSFDHIYDSLPNQPEVREIVDCKRKVVIRNVDAYYDANVIVLRKYNLWQEGA